ncbi:hypothetical protein KZA80_10745 [Proteus terrae]|nr:hypothetical protein KZA80_10745 [Proteus terrae]
MMKNLLLITSLLFSFNAYSYVYGGSNLYGSNYPSFNDMEPSRPYTDDQYSWQNYKNEAERYVDAAKEYVDKANNDIQRIQEAKSEAIENANRIIEEYNRNVRGY